MRCGRSAGNSYYVAGPQVLIDYLKQRGRPYLFSSATPPRPMWPPVLRRWRSCSRSDQAVQQLWENTRFFQAALRAVGFDLGRTQTPITPIMIGDAQRAKTFSAELFTADIFAQAVAFPTVPRGTARLRLMVICHAHP